MSHLAWVLVGVGRDLPEVAGMLPNFFILGAPKCGTTALHRILATHPEVCMTVPKEPVFFAYEWERGGDYYASRYLRHYRGEAHIGDGSTGNLFLPWVAPRIHQSCPLARLIVLVRDPVERAWSEWWMHRSAGIERDGFDEALRKAVEEPFAWDQQSWRVRHERMVAGLHHRPNPYLEPGFYADHLERYLAWFAREQLLVLFSDDLANRPQSALEQVAEFLGLSRPLEPLAFRENRARGRLGNVLNRMALRLRLERWLPAPWIRAARDLLIALGDRPQPLDDANRARLRRLYEPHDVRLRQLLGRPLPWRPEPPAPRPETPP